MRALLDTCIIVDALQSREGFAGDAQQLFLMAANNQFSGAITAKSVTDIYYLMHKFTHNDGESRHVINKLFVLFNVLDTSGIDCQKALLSSMSDYEDAVMIETAIRTEMDCIITRNTRHYKSSSLTVLTPKEFIALQNA